MRSSYSQSALLTRRRFLAQSATVALTNAFAFAQSAHADIKKALRTYRVPHTDLVVSRIAFGCSRLVGWRKESPTVDVLDRAERTIRTAHDQGINFFDHADGYGYGHSEAGFGAILKRSPGLRE